MVYAGFNLHTYLSLTSILLFADARCYYYSRPDIRSISHPLRAPARLRRGALLPAVVVPQIHPPPTQTRLLRSPSRVPRVLRRDDPPDPRAAPVGPQGERQRQGAADPRRMAHRRVRAAEGSVRCASEGDARSTGSSGLLTFAHPLYIHAGILAAHG